MVICSQYHLRQWRKRNKCRSTVNKYWLCELRNQETILYTN